MTDPVPELAEILLSCPNCFEGRLDLLTVEPHPNWDGVKLVTVKCERCRFTDNRPWRSRRH